MQEVSVLLMGFRRQLVDRLVQRKIPFVVWHDGAMKRPIPDSIQTISNVDFPQSAEAAFSSCAKLLGTECTFSHVIAGTESSVVAASFAREHFGSRLTNHSTAMRCHDKRHMKNYLHSRGIPLIPFSDPESESLPEACRRLKFPMVIKATNLSGRQGMTIARNRDELNKKLADRNDYLLEHYVNLPEVSVESWIESGQIRFSSTTEYVDKTWINLVPSRLSLGLNQQLLDLNCRVVRELGIEWGMTHAEYFIDGDQIFLGEIAWRPPGGYLMELMSLAYQFDAWDAFLCNQLGWPTQYPVERSLAAASVLFHPGSGKLCRIRGQSRLHADPHLQELRFLRRVGQTIEPRKRVSNAVAYAIFAGTEIDHVLESAINSRRELQFEVVSRSRPSR